MSYFLFGAVEHSSQEDNLDLDMAWQLVKTGIRNNLFLFIGPSIYQENVNEMILKQAGFKGISFLITGSPLENTSDSLISPYQHPGTWHDSLSDCVSRLSNWASEVLRLNGVVGITLGMTEGYDTNFEELSLTLEDFQAELIKRFKEYGDVPSLKVRIH